MSDWADVVFGTTGGWADSSTATRDEQLVWNTPPTAGTTVNVYGGGGGGGANKKQRTKNMAAELSDRAKQLGLTFADTEIAKMAKDAVDNNWSEAVILDQLLIATNWQTVTGGDLTAGTERLKGIGAGYLVPIATEQAQDWSLRMARGELTEAGVTSMIQQQARARYAWMGELIDQGVRPADYFAPIRNVVADTLEMTPDQINLLDPSWMQMLEVRDAKTGQVRGATMNEAMLAARKRPEWAATKGAQDMTAETIRRLGSMFGRAG